MFKTPVLILVSATVACLLHRLRFRFADEANHLARGLRILSMLLASLNTVKKMLDLQAAIELSAIYNNDLLPACLPACLPIKPGYPAAADQPRPNHANAPVSRMYSANCGNDSSASGVSGSG